MQDIVLTARRLRLELLILLTSFVVAELVNIYAIITYETPWTEVITKIGFVLVLTAVLYAVHWLIRLIVFLCLSIVRKIARHR